MRDLSVYEECFFDAVVAPCNVLDTLPNHEDRLRTLDEIGRVLRAGGLFVLSAHNRGYVPRLRKPTWLLSRWPKQRVERVLFFPRWMRNHMRLRAFALSEEEYAIVNDDSHDYALLHYYITPCVCPNGLGHPREPRPGAGFGTVRPHIVDFRVRPLG